MMQHQQHLLRGPGGHQVGGVSSSYRETARSPNTSSILGLSAVQPSPMGMMGVGGGSDSAACTPGMFSELFRNDGK